jgi:hypothetical protein
MLAYFFTHWPLEAIPAQRYEEALLALHRTLANSAPKGFRQSWSLAVQGLRWANRGQSAYEDWYLVEDFAALGILNEAAVSAPHLEAHAAVARLADGGKGGVYALAGGACDPTRIRCASWFSKPAGMSYAACFQQLETLIKQPGAALWQRQMVLGPGPEFCLHTAQPLALPEAYQTLQIEVRRV